MTIYLDYNATAPLRPEAVAAMQALLESPLNPSSVHRFGRDSKKYLEDARRIIADAVSAWPGEIVFTASATEANATVLRGFAGRKILVSAVEHSSVLKNIPSLRGSGTTEAIQRDKNWVASPSARNDSIIPVTASGVIDLAALDALLAEGGEALVSVMLANNETGVIQPLREVSALCKKYGALLHCDAVQGLGKIPVDFGALGADLMTISGHKCGGPVGAAALVVRKDLAFTPLLTGGGQELSRRAGTENVAAIAGFAKALEFIDYDQMGKLRSWLDGMEAQMEKTGGIIFGAAADRLPNTSCVAMPGVAGEIQLMDFDLQGFAVSTGSACSSGRIETSHVLMAMGVSPALASSAIRISGGWQTTKKDIQDFTALWLATATRLAKRAG